MGCHVFLFFYKYLHSLGVDLAAVESLLSLSFALCCTQWDEFETGVEIGRVDLLAECDSGTSLFVLRVAASWVGRAEAHLGTP